MMILDISGEEHLERLELSIKLLLWFEFQKHQNNFTVQSCLIIQMIVQSEDDLSRITRCFCTPAYIHF